MEAAVTMAVAEAEADPRIVTRNRTRRLPRAAYEAVNDIGSFGHDASTHSPLSGFAPDAEGAAERRRARVEKLRSQRAPSAKAAYAYGQAACDDDLEHDLTSEEDPIRSKEQRKQQRKIRNRIAAAESRRRKQDQIATLEQQVAELKRQNCELKRKLDVYEKSNVETGGSMGKRHCIIRDPAVFA